MGLDYLEDFEIHGGVRKSNIERELQELYYIKNENVKKKEELSENYKNKRHELN